jgi:cytochrome c-type biogenesis protein CcmE
MKSQRIFAIGAIVVAIGGIAWIALGNLGENLVYYWTPAELHQNAAKAAGATVRLGGMVKAGSIVQGTPLTFEVTDGTDTVKVSTTEIPPAMFREGIGVVVEGTVVADGSFQSKRLMVKHDNEYRAPKDGKMPDEKAMFGTLDDAATPAATP